LRVFLILFFLLIALPESLLATQAVLQNEEVVIQFEKPLENAAKEVADIYTAVKAELENTFKWRLDFRPTVILIKDSKTFQKIVESSLIVAVAVPQKNLIVIDNSKMNVHPFTLEITLKHELCHLMLHHHISEGNLPKWLNEGIAQWSSGGIAEIIMGESRDVLKQASLSGEFISLRGLTDKFPEDERAVLLAYEESKSIVEYITREFGASGLLQVLNHLKNGYDVDAAIFKGLSVPFYELENRWHDYLQKRTTWFTYFSNNLYNVLFFLAGLILTYGFIRFLLKKKAYKDEGEDNIEDFRE
jgi:hypothetical protein